MLPKNYRLPASRISHVLRYGKRVGNQLFQLSTEKGETVSRFSFIVSTKIDKRATRRNRIRRLLSESVHHQLQHIAPGCDYVFVVRKNFSDAKQVEMEKMVMELFQKV